MLWQLWTDDLITERRRCHELELSRPMHIARGNGLFNHATLQSIRYHKNRIAQLIEGRFEVFGAEAFPRQLAHAVMGDQGVLDWCGTWEIHQDPHRTWLASHDLWTPHILEPAMEGNYPPIREPEVIARYPLPAEVLSALANR